MLNRLYILLFLLIFLSGCIGPKYCVSPGKIPKEYKYNKFTSFDCGSLATWWKQFNDPILEKLILDAAANNYDLRIAVEKIEEARAFYQIKRSELYPLISLVGQATKTKFSRNIAEVSLLSPIVPLIPRREFTYFQVGFDALWEIDIWGKIWHAKNGRLYLLQAQIQQMRDVYIMLLAEVAKLYIEVTALNIKQKLLRKNYNINNQLLSLFKDLWQAGIKSRIELTEQEQVVYFSLNQVKQNQTQLAQTKNQLAVILGLAPECFNIKTKNFLPLVFKPINVGIPSDLLRRRPDIRKAEEVIAASHEFEQAAVAEWFPSFLLFGGVGLASSSGSLLLDAGSITWNIGTSMLWPVLNFGRINARIEEKQSQKRQAILAYCQTIIKAFKDVEDFLVAYFNNIEQYKFLKNQFSYAKQQKILVKDKFNSGLDSKLNFLVAARNSLIKEIELVDITQVLNLNLISLYKALGGGW